MENLLSKAKKYKGNRIKLDERLFDDILLKRELNSLGVDIYNTLLSKEDFYNQNKSINNFLFSANLDNLYLVEKNLDLYRISYVKPHGDKNILADFRKSCINGQILRKRSIYATIDDICNLIEEGSFIYIEKAGEIEEFEFLETYKKE